MSYIVKAKERSLVMKKSVSLLMSLIILAFIFLSSCDIPRNIKQEITEKEYRKPFTFIAYNAADLNKKESSAAFGSKPGTTVSLSKGGAIATEPSMPPLPWDKSLSVKGVIDSGIVEGGGNIELKLTLKANNQVLSDGELQLVFETKDYKLLKGGEPIESNTYIVEDFFENEKLTDAEPIILTLSPDFEDDFAFGCVEVWVRFVPDDIDSFKEKMTRDFGDTIFYLSDHELENGYVSLTSGAISYAVDSVSAWLARGTSYGDVYNDMTGYHYDRGLISLDEMARLCFGFRYSSRVISAICDLDESDHSMRIAYYSKNVRYESSFRVTDDKLEKAIGDHEEFWETNHYMPAKGGRDVTTRILEIMKEKGVITENEFDREIALLDEVQGIYTNCSSVFPGISTGYSEIDALHLTHKDK